MDKYALGTDIPIRWSLGEYTPVESVYFEIYTGAGRKRVTDFTITDNVLSWTFLGADQSAYGVYGLHLIAGSQEYRLDQAFELIHGTPAQQVEAQSLSSSLEIDATEQEQEETPESAEPVEYVSPSPLHLEKIPLGSNIVLNWNLLTAGDFDFDLAECDLVLYYSAAGSGKKLATNYELLTDDGYTVQWNFAGTEQVRYGLYSLFLEVYKNGLIAVLEREYAFELTHRNGSDFIVDRIISFDSVVTSLGGGAMFSLYDVLNDGHSTVYRSDGVTRAANGDILIFNGTKWYAINPGNLSALQSLGIDIAGLTADVNGLTSRVTNAEGDISTISQRAASIDLRVADAEGNIGDLELTATALAARMESAEGDIGVLELTATGLTTRITNAEGDIGSLELTATGLTTRISNAEGDISTLTQTATSLTSRIQNAEGDISVLEQTATGLQYQVSNQAGDIATLQISARGLTSRVSDAEGNISVIEQTVERIGLQVQGVDDELARYETITDSTIEDMQRQIDGAIETWFYMGAPTLLNQPAVNWTTVAEKNNHLGDLYYDKLTGYAYRFMVDETVTPAVYSWGRITDVDVTKALADAAHAQATADGKLKMFLVQPTPPYHLGDLWVKSDGTIFKCVVEKPNDDDVYAASDWSSSDFASKMVVKANFDVLANAIIGTVAGYDADGKITSATATQFEQSIDRISFSVAKVGSALLPTGINIADEIITIRSNNFFLAGNGVGDPAALTITYRNNVPYISASNLDITGILSTNEWTAEEAILNGYADNAAGVALLDAESYADGVSGTAETNAKNYAYNYANSTEYLNGVIQVLISNSISGKADESDYSYLRTALDNKTAALGGLLLTSLIQLGATESGGGWTVHAGISGVYDTTKLGNGIAAWYGGPMTDWKSLTEQQRLTTPFAKSLFRMDGSGYLASGEIQWGSAGDIILHGVGIESAALDKHSTLTDGTTTFTVEDLILLRSWFSIDYYLDSSSQRHYYLKLNASGSDGTAIEGFVSNGFISAGGISSGGGSAGIDKAAMWNQLTTNTDTTYGQTKIHTDHIPDMATTYSYLKLAGMWQSLQNNDNADTSTTAKIHNYHLPACGTGLSYTLDANGMATNIGIASGYYLPSTSDQSNWNAKVDSSTLANYLPLSAGSSKPLTDSVYINEGYGVEAKLSSSSMGILCYKPTSFTGVANTQWTVGAFDCQGVIRSSNSDLVHYRHGSGSHNVLDSYNYTSYALPLSGGKTITGTYYMSLGTGIEVNGVGLLFTDSNGNSFVGRYNSATYIRTYDSYNIYHRKVDQYGTETDWSIFDTSNYTSWAVSLDTAQTITARKTISTTNFGEQLEIHRNESNYDAMIKYSNYADGTLGYLGLRGSGTSAAEKLSYNDGTNSYAIYHSGNSNKTSTDWTCQTLYTYSGTAIAFRRSSATQFNIEHEPSGIGFYDATNTRYLIYGNSSGNVGIGTASPGSYKLNVAGNFYAGGTYSSMAQSTDGDCLLMHTMQGTSSYYLLYCSYGESSLGTITNPPALVVRANGYVGIGISQPSYTFDVSGTARFSNNNYAQQLIIYRGAAADSAIRYENSNGLLGYVGVALDGSFKANDANDYNYFKVTPGTTARITNVNAGEVNLVFIRGAENDGYNDWRLRSVGGDFHFQFAPYSTWTTVMTLRETSGVGKVGIGTEGPSTKLYVKDTNYDILCLHRDDSAYGAGIQFSNNNGVLAHFGYDNYDYCFKFQDASYSVMVSINKLNGNLTSVGAVTAGSASDIRLKSNITTMTRDYAKGMIMSLRPVNFVWNELARSKQDTLVGADYGVVAQEVESICPQSVSPIWKEYKRVDYTKFVTPLICVAQDHETRIRELERENKELKEEIKRLRS